MVLYYMHLILSTIVDFFYGLYYRSKKQTIPPINNPILRLSAKKLGICIRKQEVTCVEVINAHIQRIKEVNGIINAVVDERFEEALNEAQKVDQQITSGNLTPDYFNKHPLLGVPFTTKESTLCKGMKASFGLIPRKNVIADEDAMVVQYMKEAGGILLAVTNVPQLNLWTETHNPVYGLTRNPYDTTRTSGGSSGGEAALIASCGSPIGLGTDIGGSIRIPAFMCGLFGHKCSPQLTNTKGLTYRDGSEAETTMVVAGPITRHSEDLTIGLKAILGAKHTELDLDQSVNVEELKYYFIDDNGDPLCTPLSTEMKNVIKMVVEKFERFTKVEKLEMDGIKYSTKLYRYWLNNEQNSNFKHDITGRLGNANAFIELFKYIIGRSDLCMSAIFGLINTQIIPMPGKEWSETLTNQIRNDLIEKLGDDGILFYPSWPTTASYHHTSYFRMFNFSYMNLFNALKLPVTQVPLGLGENGLPIGIQVVAAPKNDRLCIAVASKLEKLFGGYVQPFESL